MIRTAFRNSHIVIPFISQVNWSSMFLVKQCVQYFYKWLSFILRYGMSYTQKCRYIGQNRCGIVTEHNGIICLDNLHLSIYLLFIYFKYIKMYVCNFELNMYRVLLLKFTISLFAWCRACLIFHCFVWLLSVKFGFGTDFDGIFTGR